MGPHSDLPSRPRFSWDTKSVPWTDGKGNQDEYKRSITLWRSFHDKLPANNSNKIPIELRGIMLKSQLFGRARDLCTSIPDEDIASAEGVNKIVQKLYTRDALTVVRKYLEISMIFCQLNALTLKPIRILKVDLLHLASC